MTQSLVFVLILLALVLPVVGAMSIRLLGTRLTIARLYVAAALIFVIAAGSVLALANSEIPNLQIGNLSILLPMTTQDDVVLEPASAEQIPSTAETWPTDASIETTITVVPTAETAEPTALPTATETALPTATFEPPTATAEPPTETLVPPTETPAPAAQRKYTVQAGDTLGGIARQFNTTVQAIIDANHLTPQQADALRVGQELIIP